MKEQRLKSILDKACTAYSKADTDIWYLRDDFEGGKIAAAAVRRKYAALRKVYFHYGKRYFSLVDSARKYNAEAFKYYTPADICDKVTIHDTFFNE